MLSRLCGPYGTQKHPAVVPAVYVAGMGLIIA